MTKKQLIRELEKNEVLKPITEDTMTSISFAHVSMVENIGKAIDGKHHAFRSIIKAERVDGVLTISLPLTSKYPSCYRCGGRVTKSGQYVGCEVCGEDQSTKLEEHECTGECDKCEYGKNVIGECEKPSN